MISPIEDVISEIAAGRMIILVDDEDRENEGDLLLPATFASAEAINFMASQGRGLICLTLTRQQCERLNLPMMSANNGAAFGTNFTVSIEAARGVTTGISAHDRTQTILAASNPHATSQDVVTPGHIFPLRADSGGVLVRAGHTEAGCDLARMAGLFPAAVICEIMNDDGTMARMDDLKKFAARHQLKIGAIKSIIEYRLNNELLVKRQQRARASTIAGDFDLTVYKDAVSERLHLAFCYGDINAKQSALTRVLVEPTCLDGMLTSLPERSWSISESLQRIAQDGCGVLLLLGVNNVSHDKVRQQLDSLQKSPRISGAGQLRTYGIGAQILRDLGVGRIRLLSSRMKITNLDAFGLTIDEVIER